MPQIFSLLYLFFFLGAILTALFIAYHIIRYSLARQSVVFGMAFFGFVFLILLFMNVFLFSQIDWVRVFESRVASSSF